MSDEVRRIDRIDLAEAHVDGERWLGVELALADGDTLRFALDCDYAADLALRIAAATIELSRLDLADHAARQ